MSRPIFRIADIQALRLTLAAVVDAQDSTILELVLKEAAGDINNIVELIMALTRMSAGFAMAALGDEAAADIAALIEQEEKLAQ